MSGCLLCLHLDLGLKAGFEFKVEVIFVDRDPLDQKTKKASGATQGAGGFCVHSISRFLKGNHLITKPIREPHTRP